MRKGILPCPFCAAPNSYFNRVCTQCGSTLRDRVVNLDFQPTLTTLMHSPGDTFRKIIFAEHKNFSLLLLIIFAIKAVLITFSVTPYIVKNYTVSIDYFALLFVLALTAFFIWAGMQFWLFRLLGVPSRFKDQLAVLAFSASPAVIQLFIFFPLEFVIYGQYLFSAAPGAWELNATFFWFFVGLETLLLIWSQFLLFKGFRQLNGGVWISASLSLLFFPLLLSFLLTASVALAVYA